MKKQIVLGLLLSTATLACAETVPIGSQVHEGPTARSGGCFVATAPGSQLVWVHPDGGRTEGPEMPARALAYDDHRDGLWVTGHDSIRFVAQGVTETEIGVANPRGAWPLPTGLLVEGQLGKWTHHDEFGEVTSRVLPSALSWWRNGDVVQWLGPRHPRHPGPVLVSTDAQHPLLAPEVSPVDTRDGDVRAAPTAGGDVVFAKAEGGHLHLEIHDARWRLPIAGEGLDSFIWLGDDRYVVTTQAPELVFQLELESHDIHELDGLRGPLAGPVPCPFMNSLP